VVTRDRAIPVIAGSEWATTASEQTTGWGWTGSGWQSAGPPFCAGYPGWGEAFGFSPGPFIEFISTCPALAGLADSAWRLMARR
jgi:hypothetical protein